MKRKQPFIIKRTIHLNKKILNLKIYSQFADRQHERNLFKLQTLIKPVILKLIVKYE